MNTGKIISDLREKKGWVQKDLAEKSGISRVMIGKYERDEAVPSIEAAKKIAQALEVSLDYLAGEGVNATFDKRTVKRLQQIDSLNEEDKTHLLAIIDAFLRNANTRKEYGS
ncbi:helix-turn-helix domain-containing protein [Hufsiella ginkgonis]|uniref:Helix-turn-helix domain-containing protein n=1 Tax=Hufsiella ginkgonis TaxID=2695274 RepID=A0A7K1XT91_9SPHI|nr:helix-turn-helix transcriptional regulator [Hufsiella ginkgonis]MXV14174.1 helix-turn-helix domain-containing protein [Hufsiella ginkgonis]